MADHPKTVRYRNVNCVCLILNPLCLGDVSSLEIDQFSFSLGSHELSVNFTCENGDSGNEIIEFEGQTRPRTFKLTICV